MEHMKLGTYKISDRAFLKAYKPDPIDSLDGSRTYSCDVLLWNNNHNFGTALLPRFPNLKLLINWGTDDNNLVDLELLQKRIAVKKVDFYAQQSMCEYVLMLMVAFEHSQEKTFHDIHNYTKQLYGKNIGIVGLGKIGFCLAKFLHNSFNCKIFYNTPKNYNIPNFQYVSKKEIVRTCDYVIIVAKSRTCAMDAKTLKDANPDLVILNISRDFILPFVDIQSYLRKKKIRGFIGDVTQSVPSKSVAKHVLIAPKIGFQTKEAIELKQNIALFYLKQFKLQSLRKTSRVYIARHGSTVWNSKRIYQGTYDSPLTADGILEAKRLSAFLSDTKISTIFTSPLGRAQETSKIVAHRLKIPIHTISSFIEMSFGIFQEKSRDQVSTLFEEFFIGRKMNPHNKLFVPYPNGESYFDVYLRTVSDVMRLLVSFDDFLIVGHESVNRIIRGIITGKSLTQMVNSKQKHNEVIEIDIPSNAERTIVV